MRKFTVTPVKESAYGVPVSELKGLFRADTVEPLDSDSDLSLGGRTKGKSMDDLVTGVGKETELEQLAAKLSHPQAVAQADSDSEGSPAKTPRPLAEAVSDFATSPVKLPQTEPHFKSAVTDIHAVEIASDGVGQARTGSGTDPNEYGSSAHGYVSDYAHGDLIKEQNEKLASWQKKLDEELKEKMDELKNLQVWILSQICSTSLRLQTFFNVILSN